MDRRLVVLALVWWSALGCNGWDPGLKPPCERSVAASDGCGFAWECGREGRVTVTCVTESEAPAACTCSVVGGRVEAASTLRTFESASLCGLVGQSDADEVARIEIVERECGYSIREQLRDAGSSRGP